MSQRVEAVFSDDDVLTFDVSFEYSADRNPLCDVCRQNTEYLSRIISKLHEVVVFTESANVRSHDGKPVERVYAKTPQAVMEWVIENWRTSFELAHIEAVHVDGSLIHLDDF